MPRRPAATAILGTSPALQRALAAVDRVARTEASVVLHGESGTGKELFARELHDRSGRTGEFVPVNCAAIPEALLES
ncbi:MAG TPA: sigma 54-interacting transcriptional regulator, partial [Myxococcota bacterium]|nr:sigma 54-interacting transcriptional regulator [Myxococcota bacterium]